MTASSTKRVFVFCAFKTLLLIRGPLDDIRNPMCQHFRQVSKLYLSDLQRLACVLNTFPLLRTTLPTKCYKMQSTIYDKTFFSSTHTE